MRPTFQETLRRLAIADRRLVAELLVDDPAATDRSDLDARSLTIARVAALVAHGGSAQTFRSTIGDALEADVTPDEIVGVVLATAPVLGITTIVDVASKVALALDYDVDGALEALEPP